MTEAGKRKRKKKNGAHHFDSDSAVAFARLCEHIAPTLTKVPQSHRFGCLLYVCVWRQKKKAK